MRIKRGQSKKQKHKKVLKQAKGYRMTYSRLYRRAKEALLHAGQYSFAHRRARRSQKREEWIKIISAALHSSGVSYNKFFAGLKSKNIVLDRKVLAEIAQQAPADFAKIVKQAQ